ncbi:MAG: zinc metallopeptidase [Eubacteriales bacterium]|nr:zinc metallopeptidase [Eubacteriales bacterium]
MSYLFWSDPTWSLLLIGLLVGLIAQSAVNGAYNKYARVPSAAGFTGAEAARRVLDSNGLYDVAIEAVQGRLSDHYDPRARVLRLSSAVYGSSSLAALGIAVHEVGHALQHAQGYKPLALRSTLVPLASVGSSLSWPIFLLGLVLSIRPLLYVGIIAFALAVVFQLITLPVEFNASLRALTLLNDGGYLTQSEQAGTRKVLRAAAMTYVAAALASILQLLRLLMLAGGGRRRD